MSAQPALYAIRTSPWSEKARWALDHHGLRYQEREYTPLLGEPVLRWKLRRARGPVSVPVLFAGDQVYDESFDIAHWAERHGGGAPLFRRGDEEAIARWNQLADRAMSAGRALLCRKVADDPRARQEALPRAVPAPLRRPLGPAALVGARYLLRKYAAPPDDAGCRAELRAELLELRAALADGRRHLLGDLSYADIAMAVALQFVQPVDDGLAPHLRLGAATRRAWTDLELAGELNDLVEWRDQLYARHRERATHIH